MATRLSVSAIKDFKKCGRYYKLTRIDKRKPDQQSHSLQAGSLVHTCYYYAWGNPTKGEGWRMNWNLTGEFQRERALAMYDTLWAGEIQGGLSGQELAHAVLLLKDQKPWSQIKFRPGQLKHLKVEGQAALKDAWGAHFRTILADCLATPLPAPIKEIEREVRYSLGGVEMLGFIDLVLQNPDGTEDAIDLKTTHGKPSETDLTWNEQMNTYYLEGFSTIYLWHLRSTELLPVPRNLWLMGAMQESAPVVMDAIEAGLFLPRHDAECAYCDVRKWCREGEAL